MFFGAATDAQSAHCLLSLAAEQGVNVFDTAEMYPVPQRAQHQGQSEITLGNWLKTQSRCDVSLCIHVRKADSGSFNSVNPVHLLEVKAFCRCVARLLVPQHLAMLLLPCC